MCIHDRAAWHMACQGAGRATGSPATAARMRRSGDVAEWLGRGLQSLVQRFESARRLAETARSPGGLSRGDLRNRELTRGAQVLGSVSDAPRHSGARDRPRIDPSADTAPASQGEPAGAAARRWNGGTRRFSARAAGSRSAAARGRPPTARRRTVSLSGVTDLATLLDRCSSRRLDATARPRHHATRPAAAPRGADRARNSRPCLRNPAPDA